MKVNIAALKASWWEVTENLFMSLFVIVVAYMSTGKWNENIRLVNTFDWWIHSIEIAREAAIRYVCEDKQRW